MSSDTAKENASVVDSSVTVWKNDMPNLEGPGSPSCKTNENLCHTRPDEQGHCCDEVGTSSAAKKDKLYGTRYFIIKSLNYQNIQLSIEKGIWATQPMNEPILEDAFLNSGKVILIFSVNMSGFFQGYAQMMSSVGWRRDDVWSRGSSGSNPWGRSFKVKWLQLHDLPFQKTLHLKNPLNHYKPVKISRDCQELPPDIGEALCKLLDENIDFVDTLKDNVLPKRPCIESSCFSRDEECNVPSIHMTLPQAPIPYPLMYPHLADGNRFNVVHQHPAGLNVIPVSSKVAQSKHSCISENLTGMHVDQDTSQFDAWSLSAERSPLASTVTEDDILDMTYEEYLEAHSRSNKQLYNHACRPSWRIQESSSSKEYDDDKYSPSPPKKRSC